MRVLVCGGRDYDDVAIVTFVLSRIDWKPGDVLIHGAAPGADRLAGLWGSGNRTITVESYPANWKKYGRRAGPIRNRQMLDTGVDLVIAFPGGTGTAGMKLLAHKAGVTVLEVS